ncbi:class I tRNA ligase family protein, partial [Patescibacteria group bacterium]|nr:class I tRNA ligase family protein [Patescibacteria group bacterium]
MTEYNPQKIEKKWQKYWKKKGIYKTKDSVKGKKNFYHLVMFPYPSGDLHIGHWYNFAPADVYARFKKMSGFNVMSPIGFDAFGLPAENAAIKRGIHPEKWTYANIKAMSKQIESMGNMFDWSREIITADPNYYKWTQWIFLQLYKNGLAYKKKAPANWCPKCHTVLANEQVVDGKCERCDVIVVQRDIEQWLFRITKYADKLLEGLDGLDWPEKTKLMQKNWIGKSEGTLIQFPISNFQFPNKSQNPNDQNFLEVFTTRIDTILGCTYCVIAPEHEIISNLKSQISNLDEVEGY